LSKFLLIDDSINNLMAIKRKINDYELEVELAASIMLNKNLKNDELIEMLHFLIKAVENKEVKKVAELTKH